MGLAQYWCLLLGVCLAVVHAENDKTTQEAMFEEIKSTTIDPLNNAEDYMGPDMDLDAVVEYLRKYEYTNEAENTGKKTSYEEVREAIKAFQVSAGLEPTGDMTEESRLVMRLPRCGLKTAALTHRMKRYVLRGSRWGSSFLTYKFVRYTRQLTPSKIDQITQRALKYWADVTPLRFGKRSPSQNADLDILYQPGAHGDRSPFDGRGGTLAHAYYPGQGRISGDAHFDDAERWTDSTYLGTNLLQVATHEFGHSLGLGHSNIQAAVMAPFYRGYQPSFRLHADDIAGIRAIYGDRGSPSSTRAPPSGGGCTQGFDAVSSSRARNNRVFTIAFKGAYYYLLGTRSGIRISEKFRYLTSVDAAYSRTNTRYSNRISLFLFKGSKVYFYEVRLYSNNQHTVTYLRNLPISSVIRGLPSNIDAIFKWSSNGKIYIFKGDKYYRIRGNQVDRGYPRSISIWNLPRSVRRINGAYTYTNRRTYFFVGRNYYRYAANSLKIDRGYPRPISRWWRQCGASAGNLEAEPTPIPDEELEDTLSKQLHTYNTVDQINGATVTTPTALSFTLAVSIVATLLLIK